MVDSSHQRVQHVERLLAAVGLGEVQGLDVHPKRGRQPRVQRVLRVDEGRDPARPLGLRDRIEGDRRLSRALRPEYLHDAPLGVAPDAKRDVQRQDARGNYLHVRPRVVAQTHDGSLPELSPYVLDGLLQHLLARLRHFFLRQGQIHIPSPVRTAG